jgi:hypothetical protein
MTCCRRYSLLFKWMNWMWAAREKQCYNLKSLQLIARYVFNNSVKVCDKWLLHCILCWKLSIVAGIFNVREITRVCYAPVVRWVVVIILINLLLLIFFNIAVWQECVTMKRQLTQDPHSATSQKTIFFSLCCLSFILLSRSNLDRVEGTSRYPLFPEFQSNYFHGYAYRWRWNVVSFVAVGTRLSSRCLAYEVC